MDFLRSIEKYSIILAALLFVAFGMILFGDVAGELRRYFMITGRWDDVIYITVFVLLIGYILRKLLIWEVKLQKKF